MRLMRNGRLILVSLNVTHNNLMWLKFAKF